MQIGLLRLDEAEALTDLAGRIWRACYPGMISMEQIQYMLAQRYKPGLVRQLLARGDLWLAARAEGELIGFAHGHPLPGDDYKLDKLYVRPDLQRHGIGGALVAETARHARHHGSERLILRVNRQNHPAIQSYLKHGFRIATTDSGGHRRGLRDGRLRHDPGPDPIPAGGANIPAGGGDHALILLIRPSQVVIPDSAGMTDRLIPCRFQRRLVWEEGAYAGDRAACLLFVGTA